MQFVHLLFPEGGNVAEMAIGPDILQYIQSLTLPVDSYRAWTTLVATLLLLLSSTPVLCSRTFVLYPVISAAAPSVCVHSCALTEVST